jgi:hypothetical protein
LLFQKFGVLVSAWLIVADNFEGLWNFEFVVDCNHGCWSEREKQEIQHWIPVPVLQE